MKSSYLKILSLVLVVFSLLSLSSCEKAQSIISYATHRCSFTDYKSNGDATCTKDGTKTGKCSCGARWTVTDFGSKLEHTYEYTENNDATCTTDGTKTGECSCGAVTTVTSEGTAKGHDLKSEEAKAPTCTEAGWDAYEACSRCNFNTRVEIEALGHSFTNYVSDNNAEVGVDGTKTATCDRCPAIDTITDEGSALSE